MATDNTKKSFAAGKTVKGDAFSEETLIDSILNSAYRIITTPIGSDFENPMYGCKIKNTVFKQATDDVLITIKDSITTALQKFEPVYSSLYTVNVYWAFVNIVGKNKYVGVEVFVSNLTKSKLTLILNFSDGTLKRV